MTNLLYWAEPIDQAQGTDYNYDHVKYATMLGWSVFRPMTAFVTDGTPTASVEQANRAVLAQSGALLAWLPLGVPTIGVPAEIEAALQAGIPVGIVTDNAGSWAIGGFEERGAIVDPSPQFVLDHLLTQRRGNRLGFVDLGGGTLPTRTHSTDVGFDLYASEETKVPVGAFRDIPTAVACNLPADKWGLITGRSSTMRKHGLLVVNGIIDPGFRGQLYGGVVNVGQHPVTVEKGQRVAQLILLPAYAATPGWDAYVTASDRGLNGFGSSGA